MDLAPPAYNIEQLKKWIEKIKSESKEKKAFINNFNKILPRSKDDATKKAVKVVLGFTK
jgi:hypothetical protein